MKLKEFAFSINNLFDGGNNLTVAGQETAYLLQLTSCTATNRDGENILVNLFKDHLADRMEFYYQPERDDENGVFQMNLLRDMDYPGVDEDRSLGLGLYLKKTGDVMFDIWTNSDETDVDYFVEKYPMLEPEKQRTYAESIADLRLYVQALNG